MYVFKSSLFWGVAQGRLIVADVSVQPVGSIFKGLTVLGFLDPCSWDRQAVSISWWLNIKSTLRKIPEERIYRLHHGGNLSEAKYVLKP